MDLQVNFSSLLLLFAVSLIVHLLISRLTLICQTILKVARLITATASTVQGDLVKEISALQKEQSALNPVDDFAKHAKLQRKILAKQSALKDAVSREKKSLRWNVKFPLYIILRILLEIITLIAVWHCAEQPVLIAPENWFHPLDKLLYPLWNRGSVGSLFWMISCRQALRQFSNSVYLL